MVQPITLYSHGTGPNPWKIHILLEELGVPYTSKIFTDLSEAKKPDFEKINPNGRVPAIEDPNTGITLWESGAIIEYLIDTYDKSAALTFHAGLERGQGPYFGQGFWFTYLHPEKIPSAIERYQKETQRVLGVLNRCLEGKQYLVGDKCTYADLSFVPWLWAVPMLIGSLGVDIPNEYPHYHAWYERLHERASVKKSKAEREQAIEAAKKQKSDQS